MLVRLHLSGILVHAQAAVNTFRACRRPFTNMRRVTSAADTSEACNKLQIYRREHVEMTQNIKDVAK